MPKKYDTPLLDELEKAHSRALSRDKEAAARATWLPMSSECSKSVTVKEDTLETWGTLVSGVRRRCYRKVFRCPCGISACSHFILSELTQYQAISTNLLTSGLSATSGTNTAAVLTNMHGSPETWCSSEQYQRTLRISSLNSRPRLGLGGSGSALRP